MGITQNTSARMTQREPSVNSGVLPRRAAEYATHRAVRTFDRKQSIGAKTAEVFAAMQANNNYNGKGVRT
jgi:hypothetical protein